MKLLCKYCDREIDARGMDSHLHFKHLKHVLAEFRVNPLVQLCTYGELRGFEQLALPEVCDGM